MRRRTFLGGAAAAAAAAFAGGAAGTAAAERMSGGPAAASPKRRIAVTIDDFALADHPALSAAARDRAILDALDDQGIRAAGFVCGKRVDSEAGRAVLEGWSRRGHPLANHTYSHAALSRSDPRDFGADVLRCEAMLADLPGFAKLFRFPYLDEGRTAEHRDAARTFLREHGYRNGHVTVDASDWYVDQRLRARLDERPDADTGGYRDYYVEHLLERAHYYEDLAQQVLGRAVPHTLLLHHNLLNGLFLGDVLDAFAADGWEWIDATVAYEDPVFASEPDALPAGQSLIWALAKATGRFDDVLRYPGENDTYEKPRMDERGL